MYKPRPRIIPCLLLKGEGLVKTKKFKAPVYLGDPRNVVKIFNDKEADEMCLLDIMASKERRGPRFALIKEIVEECFMPVAYGGGLRNEDDAKKMIALGVEKVVFNTAALDDIRVVERTARQLGSQSVVVSIDVAGRSLWRSAGVYSHSQGKTVGLLPVEYAKRLETAGAGEILLTSVARDGMMQGYDLPLIQSVADAVSIPVIACGGAGCVADLGAATKAGASAAAAGSLFVFHGNLRAVLISFPHEDELNRAL